MPRIGTSLFPQWPRPGKYTGHYLILRVPELGTPAEEKLMLPARQSISKIRVSRRSFWMAVITVTAILRVSIGMNTLAQSGKGSSDPAKSGAAYALIPSQSRLAAPELNLTDITGSRLNLSQYRGKVVLLDFWAVDCGGCVIEIPWYVEFDRKYRDKGLQLIGIDMYNESPAYIKPFMQKSHMQYPVAVGNEEIGKRFHADELPKTILIDREGRVAVSHVGIVDKAMFEHDIEELLK
jgi:peroxiredoxin